MKGNLAFIYYLQNPISGEIFYVGATQCSLHERLKVHYRHLREFEKGKRKINKRFTYLLDLKPDKAVIILLEIVTDSNIIDERESFYIKKFRDINPNLTNMTDGGKGMYTSQYYTNEEKAIYSDKISRANKGRAKPEGFAQNLSDARKGMGNPATKLIKNGGIIATKDRVNFIWFKYGFEINTFLNNKHAYGNVHDRLNHSKSTNIPKSYGYEIKYFDKASKKVQDIVQSQCESIG